MHGTIVSNVVECVDDVVWERKLCYVVRTRIVSESLASYFWQLSICLYFYPGKSYWIRYLALLPGHLLVIFWIFPLAIPRQKRKTRFLWRDFCTETTIHFLSNEKESVCFCFRRGTSEGKLNVPAAVATHGIFDVIYRTSLSHTWASPFNRNIATITTL